MSNMTRRLLRTFAQVSYPLYRLLVLYPYYLTRFRTEKRLCRGKIARTTLPKKQSVIYFTAHKCASTYLGQLLRSIASKEHMLCADFDAFFTFKPNTSVGEAFDDEEFLNTAYLKTGCVYGPHRSFREIPEVEDYRILLILRDPRDVVVSNYYSVRYSHSVLSRKMLDMRKEARETSVDNWVIGSARRFSEIYNEYAKSLVNEKLPGLVYWRYEDIVTSPHQFIASLERIFGVSINRAESTGIAADLTPRQNENLSANKRSGKPGAYREKLKTTTVHALNDIFGSSLEVLGYSRKK